MTFRNRICIVPVALALVALVSPEVRAQENKDSWFYLGASAGQTSYELDDPYYTPFNFDRGFELDQSSDAYSLHAGWQTSPYLAIELTLADLGGTEQYIDCATPFDTQLCVGFSGPFEMSTRRADLALVATVPLGSRFELLGKLGAARYKHELSARRYDGEIGDFRMTPYDTRYETRVLLGVGLRFHIDASWALRAQWDRGTTLVSAADTQFHRHPETAFDTYLLGVEYKLGR